VRGDKDGFHGDDASYIAAVPCPKIELHVHFEGTIRPATLLEIARRNDYALPADDVAGLAALNDFADFAGFIRVFELTAGALQHADDFRQVVVEYAEEAARHGAVYVEGIFTPGLWRGLDTDMVFSGYCDGAQEARERHGVEVRLTPDIPRVYSPDEAQLVVDYSLKYRERGVVGVGLAGYEAPPAQPFAAAFARARAEGLVSVPHAGEHTAAASVRDALDVLGADRVRHGIRAVEDPALVRELADRAIVLDVCPISNVRTGAVTSLSEHPLPALAAAGVRCSISTDDPAMFDTDLTREYEAARTLGIDARAAYEAGVAGAACEDPVRRRLAELGSKFAWSAADPAAPQLLS
jgi:aminodeoxyfutalosine deaminase